LGGGRNVKESDRGVDGLVVRVRVRGSRETAADATKVTLEIGAGEELDALVERSVGGGDAGSECLSGIPGDGGATPMQNVGTDGQEIGESVVAVRALDRKTRALRVFDNASCGFAYRTSVFKQALQGQYVVLTVTLALERGGIPRIRYPELARELAAR